MTCEFSTCAELDLRIEYENGPDGPEIVGVFVGELSRPQRALILAELQALETRRTAEAMLEHRLSRRDAA